MIPTTSFEVVSSRPAHSAPARGEASDALGLDADHDEALSAAYAEGFKAGVAAERERFLAVMGSDHYAGRDASALTMLTTTDMSAEAIIGVLAGLPAVAAPDAAAPSLPQDRSQNARGGLVVVETGSN